MSAIGAWCEEQGIDAWFDQSGYLCVSTTAAHDEVGRASVAAAAALGAPERVVELDGAAVRARCDSAAFRRGVLIPDFATVQPARLALGLRRRLAERGVLVHEHSPGARAAKRPRRGRGRAPSAAACARAPPCSRSVRRRAAWPRCARACR